MPNATNKPNVTLRVLSQLLGGEGFTEYAANEVKRYWNRRVMNERQAERIERVHTAFSAMVAERLDERDRIVLGKYVSLLCKMNFDTGLRIGLMTFAAGVEREEVPAPPAPTRPPKGQAKPVAARGQEEVRQGRPSAGAAPQRPVNGGH